MIIQNSLTLVAFFASLILYIAIFGATSYVNSLHGVLFGGLIEYPVIVFLSWLFGSILFVLLAKNIKKTRLILTVIFSGTTLLILVFALLDLQSAKSGFTDPNPFVSGIAPMLLDFGLLIGYGLIFSKYNIIRALVISAILLLASMTLFSILGAL